MQILALVIAFALLGACQQGDRQLVPREEAYDFGSSLSVLGNQAVVGSKGTLHFFERKGGEWAPRTIVRLGDPDFAYVSSVPGVKFCGPDRVVFAHSSFHGTLVRNEGSWEQEREFSVPVPLSRTYCNEDILVRGPETYTLGVQAGPPPGSPMALTSDGRLVTSSSNGISFHVLNGQWLLQGSIPAVYPGAVVAEADLTVLVHPDGSLETYRPTGTSSWEAEVTADNPEVWSQPMLAKGRLVGLVRSGRDEFVTALRREDGAWVPAQGGSRAFLATDPLTPDFGAMAFDGDTLLLQSFDADGTPRVDAYDF